MNEGIRDAFGIPVGSNGASTAETTSVNAIAPYTADNVQALFEQLIAAIPTLAGLASTAGAGTIGITAISGLTGTTVQAALASLESTKLESGASVVSALGYTPYPSTGGLLSGNIISTNGNGLYAMDTGGTPRQIVTYGVDNNINHVNGTGGITRWYNSSGAVVIMGLDNVGSLAINGSLTFKNGEGIKSEDAGAVVRQLYYMAGDTVVARVAGGATIQWFNQAGTLAIATLSNAGAFSAVTVTQTSDERFKKDWEDPPEEIVARFAKVTKYGKFTWTGRHKDAGQGVGAGAQQLQEVYAPFVTEGNDGFLQAHYGPAAIIGVIALSKEVEKLKAENADIKARLARLEALL